jgi:EAL domain-containing protein (putative c-di-GMP-specific phosphodiesterase class I)
MGQGYLFARPTSARDITALLRRAHETARGTA